MRALENVSGIMFLRFAKAFKKEKLMFNERFHLSYISSGEIQIFFKRVFLQACPSLSLNNKLIITLPHKIIHPSLHNALRDNFVVLYCCPPVTRCVSTV